MIETKIKCDGEGSHYSFQAKEITLSAAVAAHWWEIEVYSGDIRTRQPKTVEEFNALGNAKHACSPACARGLIEMLASELIPDEPKEESEAAANG